MGGSKNAVNVHVLMEKSAFGKKKVNFHSIKDRK
jgi:hypothetical protein